MKASTRPSTAHLPWKDRAWVADWLNFTAVHFSLPLDCLRRHVPYALEARDGRAWVSLVWFDLRRMRFGGSGAMGRCVCRPISDHAFLNVRTYVLGENGPGICFLAEWIPHRLNCVLGPLVYTLPYRFGHFTTRWAETNGTAALRIDDPAYDEPFALNLPTSRAGARPCTPGSVDEFLLERYQAYTFRADRLSRFRVAHPCWTPARADWIRCDLGFLRDAFPWFSHASLELAHVCGDLRNVEMGFPHRANLHAPSFTGETSELADGVPSPRVLAIGAG